MEDRVEALQIIHITDLHLCASGYSDRGKLASERRVLGLRMRKVVQNRNLFGWHEGTLEHDETCEEPFEKFLGELKQKSAVWFQDPKGETAPQTWLLDTGDLTTYGDTASMREAHDKLEKWRKILGCNCRILFGNHDAWPGSQPGFFVKDWEQSIELQQNQIGEFAPWRSDRWREPLSVQIAKDLRIELYALDSVSYGWWDGVVATGHIEHAALDDLKSKIVERQKEFGGKAYRILATHHPVAFPFTKEEGRAIPKLPYLLPAMRLKNADAVIDFLRNETGERADEEISPLVHLILSGHTHLGFPGSALDENIKVGRKGGLSKRQLQLVGGPTMLIRDGAEVRRQVESKQRAVDGFTNASVFPADAQFQLLRFYWDKGHRNMLTLDRRVFFRVPHDGEYKPRAALSSRSVVLL